MEPMTVQRVLLLVERTPEARAEGQSIEVIAATVMDALRTCGVPDEDVYVLTTKPDRTAALLAATIDDDVDWIGVALDNTIAETYFRITDAHVAQIRARYGDELATHALAWEARRQAEIPSEEQRTAET